MTGRRICAVYARSHTQHRTNLSTAHAAGTQLPHRLRRACEVGKVIIRDRGGYFADSFDAVFQSICVYQRQIGPTMDDRCQGPRLHVLRVIAAQG